MRKFFIYLIESPTGKKYVGQTVNMTQRMYSYQSDARNGKKNQAAILASIRKHGFSSHKVTILMEGFGTTEHSDYWEKYYIEFHKTYGTSHGLNLTLGGGGNWGRVNTEETRKKMSLNNAFRGKKMSQEQKRALADGLKEYYENGGREKRREQMLNANLMANPEIKQKMIDTLRSPKVRSIISAKAKEREQRIKETKSKRIQQFTLDGTLIAEYYGYAQAAAAIGTIPNSIQKVVLGGRKTHRGFIWKSV